MQENLMELLEIYIELTEKQDEVISKLTALLRHYRSELQHLRELNGFFEENPNDAKEELLRECLEKYDGIKDTEL